MNFLPCCRWSTIASAGALRRPDLVRAPVLGDPALVDSTPEQRDGLRSWRDGLVGFEQRVDAEVEQAVADGWSPAEARAWAASHTQVDLDMMAHVDLGPMDRVAALDALAVPTLVLAPRDSGLVPALGEVTNRLVEQHLLDGVGHCVRRDDPAYFRMVDEFLARVAG